MPNVIHPAQSHTRPQITHTSTLEELTDACTGSGTSPRAAWVRFAASPSFSAMCTQIGLSSKCFNDHKEGGGEWGLWLQTTNPSNQKGVESIISIWKIPLHLFHLWWDWQLHWPMCHVTLSWPFQGMWAQSPCSFPVMGTPSGTPLIFSPRVHLHRSICLSRSHCKCACFVHTSKTFSPVSNYFEQLSMQMSEQHLLNFCGLLGGRNKRANKNLNHQRALTKPGFWAFNWKRIRNRRVKFPMKYTQGLKKKVLWAEKSLGHTQSTLMGKGKDWLIPMSWNPAPPLHHGSVYMTSGKAGRGDHGVPLPHSRPRN